MDDLGANDVDIFWMSVVVMRASTKIEMRMIWPCMATMMIAMLVEKTEHSSGLENILKQS